MQTDAKLVTVAMAAAIHHPGVSMLLDTRYSIYCKTVFFLCLRVRAMQRPLEVQVLKFQKGHMEKGSYADIT